MDNGSNDKDFEFTEAVDHLNKKMESTKENIRNRASKISETYEQLSSDLEKINESLAGMREDNRRINNILDDCERNRKEIHTINNFLEKLKDKNYLSDSAAGFARLDYSFSRHYTEEASEAVKKEICTADMDEAVKLAEEAKQNAEKVTKNVESVTRLAEEAAAYNEELHTEKSAHNAENTAASKQKCIRITEVSDMFARIADEIIEIKRNADSDELRSDMDYITSRLSVKPETLLLFIWIAADEIISDANRAIDMAIGKHPDLSMTIWYYDHILWRLERISHVKKILDSKAQQAARNAEENDTDEAAAYMKKLRNYSDQAAYYETRAIQAKEKCYNTTKDKMDAARQEKSSSSGGNTSCE